MSTLTERYVNEVVRRVPGDQRDDIADELRTTIADTVEARGGADSAERDVLIEMGDPIRLAARYADRPLALIGPDLYPAYVRLLRILLVTVLPVVTAVLVVLDVLENNDLGSAIGTGIAAVLTVGAQMIAWVTMVFALVDRSWWRTDMAETQQWTPDDLPDAPRQDRRVAGACAAAVWNALLIGLIVWQRTAEPYRADGERLQVLDPDLWAAWIWPILAGLAGVVVLELVRIAKRRWTMPLAVLYALAEIVFALPLAWILYNQMFFNPEFLAAVNADAWTDNEWSNLESFYTVALLVVLAVSAGEILKRFREARR